MRGRGVADVAGMRMGVRTGLNSRLKLSDSSSAEDKHRRRPQHLHVRATWL